MVDGWAKYKIAVEAVFKKGARGKRGETFLWLSSTAVACKCPKLRLGRRYLLLGKSTSLVNRVKNARVVINYPKYVNEGVSAISVARSGERENSRGI